MYQTFFVSLLLIFSCIYKWYFSDISCLSSIGKLSFYIDNIILYISKYKNSNFNDNIYFSIFPNLPIFMIMICPFLKFEKKHFNNLYSWSLMNMFVGHNSWFCCATINYPRTIKVLVFYHDIDQEILHALDRIHLHVLHEGEKETIVVARLYAR